MKILLCEINGDKFFLEDRIWPDKLVIIRYYKFTTYEDYDWVDIDDAYVASCDKNDELAVKYQKANEIAKKYLILI